MLFASFVHCSTTSRQPLSGVTPQNNIHSDKCPDLLAQIHAVCLSERLSAACIWTVEDMAFVSAICLHSAFASTLVAGALGIVQSTSNWRLFATHLHMSAIMGHKLVIPNWTGECLESPTGSVLAVKNMFVTRMLHQENDPRLKLPCGNLGST
ncbi:hypothetical protein CYLTODRAFT_460436 [Cylindrobasidium torrendii FP15055 ss-10]|uniref:Uncharacterized protein n=1 Tax=Cylindrobasidium torrendii FP15055 ss-10 TaxID=1314674 RepID=A0A0D7AR04_9AGAR|nr:hypothetical protein CYLTODRAFT_460436 [Cylindrobasidium torrendii FP15055 ss-10]